MHRPPARRPDARQPGGTPDVWRAQSDRLPAASEGQWGSDQVGARDLLAFLRRRRWTILLSLGSVLAAVAVLTQFVPPTYESTVTLLVESENTAGSSGGLDILDQLGRSRRIETEMELIRSRRVLGPVVDSLFLGVFPLEGAGPDSQRVVLRTGSALRAGRHMLVRGNPGLALHVDSGAASRLLSGGDDGFRTLATFEADSAEIVLPTTVAEELVDGSEWRSSVLAALQDEIRVGRVQREANLIELTCEGRTARAARRLCQAVESSYLSLRQDLERAHASTTRDLLVEQLERVGRQLRAAEDNLTAYSRRNRVVALGDRASEEVRQQVDLQARRDVLEAERAALASVLHEVESGGRLRYRELAAFPSFLGNETVTELMTSLIELENRRAELSVTRMAQSPEIVSLDERIGSIESQLHATARSYESALAAQVASLDATIAGMGTRLSSIPGRSIEHARLERESATLGQVYTMLQGRLQEARIAESVNLPAVRVVDSAALPSEPSSPNLPLNLALGALAGLALGLGLALLREQLDPGLRGRKQVERETGLSVLSMVPHVDRPGPVLAFSASEPSGATGGRALAPSDASGSRRASRLAEQAIALEAYRGLAVDLNFAASAMSGNGVAGSGFRSVAITSATRGEGKTLTCCNLALVHASSGRRTLLVDSDTRAAGVSKFFGIGTNEPGLSDVLGDRRYDIRSVVREVRIAGGEVLSLVPAGPPVRSSVNLFEGPAFEALMRDLQGRFDLVVLDTPPLSLITDAAAIAARVEGVLIVVRSGVTEKETLDFTLQRLRRVNGNVLGVVLNDVRSRKSYGGLYDYYKDDVSR
jgi:polysaccharide biosynthesis transport protein